MSNAVYPALPGLTFDTTKSPEFSTAVQSSVSLRELRGSYASAPVWHFKLAYEFLRDDATYNELQSLGGFFLGRLGKWDSFLFTDPSDGIVTAQQIGTGNGSRTQYQLVRSFGEFNEPIANANVITSVTVSNTPTSNYSISSTGLITFNSPPAANAPILWTGTFSFRCRFKEDTLEFNNFMRNLWEAGTVEFIGSLGAAI